KLFNLLRQPYTYFLMICRPTTSTLFPYTTLFRSCPVKVAQGPVVSLLLKIPAYSDSVAWRVKILCDSDLSDVVAALHCFKHREQDRKSTRLNSSHVAISYAVFCLKKKNRIRASGQ